MTSEIQRTLRVATAPTVSSLVELREPTATGSNQLSGLTEAAGSLRSRAKHTFEDTTEIHREFLFRHWRQRTNERGKQAPSALLEELSDLGFSWRDIARMLRVSVPAVQKWRRAGGMSGDNRMQLASLLALCDQITEHYLIEEVASWFEMPLIPTVSVTPIDLFSERRPDLVLDHASGHDDVEDILTAYAPDWRDLALTGFEVYLEADGVRSIRQKEE